MRSWWPGAQARSEGLTSGFVAGLVFAVVAALLLGGSAAGAGRSPAAGKRVAAGVSQLASLPAGAQSAVSATVGASTPVFSARRSDGGFRLGGGGVAAQLDAGGVSLRAGGVSVSMTVAGLGRGAVGRAPAVRSVKARANRVSLERGALTEWYAAGPLGIEQGFTLSRRPAGKAGPVLLALKLDGAVRARQATSGTVFLTRPGRVGLRYGALSAVDAGGRSLRTSLQLRDGRLVIRVWDRGAAYPLLIDPLIQQGGKLTGTGQVGAGSFGFSVAMSADGNTALVGGPGDNGSNGAAWVFTRAGGIWTQQGSKLTGGVESVAGRFGVSVALSSDGNTALIGGNAAGAGAGAAWVFTRSGTAWSQQGAKLTGGGATGAAEFGYAVDLSADGSTALVSGPSDNSFVGAAWAFTRSGGTWSQQGAKLTGSSEVVFFGQSVALSADGSTALIGGDGDNESAGAVWVFVRSAGIWSQQGPKLTGSGETGAGQFGWSAALSSDGNTALVGGYADGGGVGAAWAFTRTAGTWTQQGSKLTADDEVDNADFGWSVALSSDGNTALIGGWLDDGGIGAAWVFTRASATWTQGSKLTGDDEIDEGSFGYAVALSSDASTALVGGPDDDGSFGAAWVFSSATATVPDPPTDVSAAAGNAKATVSFTPPASNGGAPITSYTVTASPGGATASGPASPIVVPGLTNGTAYTFTVTATNAVGESAPSAPSSPVTPSAGVVAPGAPTGVLVSPGDGAITVTFAAPSSNGGAPITSYTVTVSPGGSTVSRYAGPMFVFGLTNGTSYSVTVTATNAAGTGPPSAPSAAVVPVAGGGRPAPPPPAEGPRPAVPDPPPVGPRPPVPAH